MKREVFKIPKNKNAGVYMIYNVNNHRAYIGATQNFHIRALHHRHHLLNGTHPNKEMQQDFNNGCEFAFAVLEDMGQKCESEKVMFKEKLYIYAFRDKYIKLYNHETTEQIASHLFYAMIHPMINEIQRDFFKNFDCYIPTLQRCKPNTLKEKLESKDESVNGFINRAINETMERDKFPEVVKIENVPQEEIDRINEIMDQYKPFLKVDKGE